MNNNNNNVSFQRSQASIVKLQSRIKRLQSKVGSRSQSVLDEGDFYSTLESPNNHHQHHNHNHSYHHEKLFKSSSSIRFPKYHENISNDSSFDDHNIHHHQQHHDSHKYKYHSDNKKILAEQQRLNRLLNQRRKSYAKTKQRVHTMMYHIRNRKPRSKEMNPNKVKVKSTKKKQDILPEDIQLEKAESPFPLNIKPMEILHRVHAEIRPNEWKNRYYLECLFNEDSIDLVELCFWFIFSKKYVNRSIAKDFLQLISEKYTKFCFNLLEGNKSLVHYESNIAMMDTFKEYYPIILSECVYIAFTKTFSKIDIRRRPIDSDLYFIVSGFCPSKITLSKYREHLFSSKSSASTLPITPRITTEENKYLKPKRSLFNINRLSPALTRSQLQPHFIKAHKQMHVTNDISNNVTNKLLVKPLHFQRIDAIERMCNSIRNDIKNNSKRKGLKHYKSEAILSTKRTS